MDIAKTQQKININSTSTSKAYSSQNTSDKPFAEELKDAKNAQEADAAKKVEITKKEDTKANEENEKEDTKVNEAIDGLEDAVNEINKIGQKDELEEEFVKQDKHIADRKNIFSNEENTLIDNNMNIQEPTDKLNVQTEANMNFSSNEQPFSEFVNKNNSKEVLKSTASELAEEKAILSTMEENIAIANKNMLMKEKAEAAKKTVTVQNDSGIKKVNAKTNLTVDTIVSYKNVVMDKNDVDFFVNLVNNGVINLNDIQGAEKSAKVSKTLADLLAKAMNDNKPVRIDFDNDISVIIKIDRAGKISADFLPSSQIAEAYLKENLPLLKQRFDENNIDYNELNQRKQQKQDSQENRKKGQKDE